MEPKLQELFEIKRSRSCSWMSLFKCLIMHTLNLKFPIQFSCSSHDHWTVQLVSMVQSLRMSKVWRYPTPTIKSFHFNNSTSIVTTSLMKWQCSALPSSFICVHHFDKIITRMLKEIFMNALMSHCVKIRECCSRLYPV